MTVEPQVQGRPNKILSYFWDLASVESIKREEATKSLIEQVKQSDQEVDYCLKRLIRGLASSHDGARQGFSLALTELLTESTEIATSQVMELADQLIEFKRGLHSQEEKDMLIGRAFLWMVLYRSQRLVFTAAKDYALRAFKELTEISSKRTFLAEMCFHCIGLIACQADRATFDETVYPALAAMLSSELRHIGPNVLGLALMLKKHYQLTSKSDKERCLVWGSKEVTHKSILPEIQESLKESSSSHPHRHFVWTYVIESLYDDEAPADSDEQSKSKKSKKSESKKSSGEAKRHINGKRLKHFWNTIMEDGLIPSSTERKYLAFMIFRDLLGQVAAHEIPIMFTHNFMRNLITQLAAPNSYLKRAAQSVLSTITEVAKRDMDARLTLINQLTGGEGDRNFDQVTKSTTVRELVSGLAGSAAESYLTDLMEKFITARPPLFNPTGEDSAAGAPNEPERQCDAIRIWALDAMTGLAKTVAVRSNNTNKHKNDKDKSDKPEKSKKKGKKATEPEAEPEAPAAPVTPFDTAPFVESCLDFIASHALFDFTNSDAAAPAPAKKKGSKKESGSAKPLRGDIPEHPISERVHTAASTRLFSLLADLMNQPRAWAWELVQKVNTLESSGAKPAFAQAEDASETRQAAVKLLKKLSKKSGTETEKKLSGYAALITELYLVSYAHAAGSQDSNDSLETLNELVELEAEIVEGKVPKEKKTTRNAAKTEGKDDEDGEPESGMNVFMDILLSLLSRPSALLRAAVKNAFQAFTSDLPKSALELLISVVSSKNTTGGENDVFDIAEAEQGEAGKDEEMSCGESDDDSGSDSDDEGEGDDDDDDRPPTKKEELLIKKFELGKVLLTGDEDEAGNDLNATDAEMFALDEQIGKYFKMQKEKKDGPKETREQMMHFKYRVLELLEVYVRKEQSNPTILTLLVPLLQALHRCIRQSVADKDSAGLAGRLETVLRKLCKTKSVPKTTDPSEYITQVTAIAKSTRTGIVRKVCGIVLGYLARVCSAYHSDDEKDMARVRGVFTQSIRELLTAFLSGKDKSMNSAFFEDIFARASSLLSPLLQDLAELSQGDKKSFLKCEAFKLSTRLLRTLPQSATKDVASAAKPCRDAVVETLRNGEFSKPAYAQITLQFLLALAQTLPKHLKPEEIDALLNRQELIDILEEFKSSESAKKQKVKNMCQTSIQALRKQDASSSSSSSKDTTKPTKQSNKTDKSKSAPTDPPSTPSSGQSSKKKQNKRPNPSASTEGSSPPKKQKSETKDTQNSEDVDMASPASTTKRKKGKGKKPAKSE